jgi:hypothetical protein
MPDNLRLWQPKRANDFQQSLANSNVGRRLFGKLWGPQVVMVGDLGRVSATSNDPRQWQRMNCERERVHTERRNIISKNDLCDKRRKTILLNLKEVFLVN